MIIYLYQFYYTDKIKKENLNTIVYLNGKNGSTLFRIIKFLNLNIECLKIINSLTIKILFYIIYMKISGNNGSKYNEE